MMEENCMNSEGQKEQELLDWCEDGSEEEREEYPIDQYDLTSSPNDFNILTIFNFIESGAVKVPGFQRNYVWDHKRASKLIESLIMGLPVPQIFLYEEGRNSFLVIDGQQRLMSIYYFIKQRFPLKEKRSELRTIFEEHGGIPNDILHNDKYFINFNLCLPEQLPNKPNRFNGLNYSTLGEYKTTFDLRTIRNVIVKQISPKDDDSAIYEIFNRLNSGGINLTAQEIRMSLHHAEFFKMLSRVNTKSEWRDFLRIPEVDLHMKDIEILLRSFAMLPDGNKYNPSMMKFLNGFARDAKRLSSSEISYFESLFTSFLSSCSRLPKNAFLTTANKFSITIFESVFNAVCSSPYQQGQLIPGKVKPESLDRLKQDKDFLLVAKGKTTNRKNVLDRLKRAKEIIEIE
ncbi:MAG: DUF262 domain-containing protein [bacterium]